MVDDTSTHLVLAHDWLCGYRGGEAVLEEIAALARTDFDIGPVLTMFDDGCPLSPTVDALDHIPSFLNSLPGSARLRRWLLPLYPAAVAQLSRKLARHHARHPVDLVISTSSAAIKGLKPPPGVPHLCYCHAPARYVWTIRHEYANSPAALGLRLIAPLYRRWDARTASNVTRFLANSAYTAAQIKRCYDRDAAIVHPPVRTKLFTPPASPNRTDDWLVVSALEPYKRVDLAIQAANQANHPLLIVGQGSHRPALEALAGPTVRFLGRIPDDELIDHYRRARLLLFPQIEDFGIVAVEAQACGLPVVARRSGGALETVVENETGAFFDEPSADAIIKAIDHAPRHADDACRANAERFSASHFRESIRAHIHDICAPSSPALAGEVSRVRE